MYVKSTCCLHFSAINLILIYDPCFTTGRFSTSAKKWLKFKYKDNTLDNVSRTNDTVQMIEKTKQLVALVSDKTKFEGMRINGEYSSEFITCVNLCLAHFITLKPCPYEYNVDNYLMTIRQNQKLRRKDSKLKYTKSDHKHEKFRGWHRNGIKRYNQLVMIVNTNR